MLLVQSVPGARTYKYGLQRMVCAEVQQQGTGDCLFTPWIALPCNWNTNAHFWR